MSDFDKWAFEQCVLNGDTLTGVKGEDGNNKYFVANKTGEKFFLKGCQKCGGCEVDAMTPRTVYSCGSSDYDQREGTFIRGAECV